MLQRIYRLPLALIITVLLAGCGGSNSGAAGGEAAEGARATSPQAPAAITPAATVQIELALFVQGFSDPLYLTHSGDGSGRMFVVEKGGTVKIVKDRQQVAAPFLDITELVGSSGSEQGLLSIAFHPKYADNGLFFVYYTDQGGNEVIARYKVSGDADVADLTSAKVLLQIDDPAANHNGGLMKFGPDGYLYIGTGDGGRAGDPWGNAQNPQALLGKLLRIDVDGGDPYGIPASNPFPDGSAGAPEVWALGLRNPWRFSFDRANGALFVADVGQNQYEEINRQEITQHGMNYGWKIVEGNHCYEEDPCESARLLKPIAEYSHDFGCSVTGGYVYRGAAFPALTGVYVFGDYCSGRIWGLQESGGVWQQSELLQSERQISSFGEDQAGELYMTSLSEGMVYQIVAK